MSIVQNRPTMARAYIWEKITQKRKENVKEGDIGWALLPFNYCPFSSYALRLSSETELWSWIAEHISANKAALHLAANGGKDQRHAATTLPCQNLISLLTVGKKTNLRRLKLKKKKAPEQLNAPDGWKLSTHCMNGHGSVLWHSFWCFCCCL